MSDTLSDATLPFYPVLGPNVPKNEHNARVSFARSNLAVFFIPKYPPSHSDSSDPNSPDIVITTSQLVNTNFPECDIFFWLI